MSVFDNFICIGFWIDYKFVRYCLEVFNGQMYTHFGFTNIRPFEDSMFQVKQLCNAEKRTRTAEMIKTGHCWIKDH